MLDDVQHQVTPTNFVSESTVEPGSTADDAQYQVTPSSSVSEGAVGEFSIYLVKQEVSLEQMVGANLSKLELEDTPIVSVDDVVAYTWETHEIELTDSAVRESHG